MPFDVSQSIEIERPAHEVWPYLIAFEQVPLWEHGMVDVRQVTPGPVGVGTEVLARQIYAGRESLLRGFVTAFEDGRVATMALRGGPFDGFTVAYMVEPIDANRSRVTHRGLLPFGGGLRRPLAAFGGRASHRVPGQPPPAAPVPRPGSVMAAGSSSRSSSAASRPCSSPSSRIVRPLLRASFASAAAAS